MPITIASEWKLGRLEARALRVPTRSLIGSPYDAGQYNRTSGTNARVSVSADS